MRQELLPQMLQPDLFYLQNAGGTQFCNFYIGDNGSGANNLKFGINKTGNTGATFASTNYTFNQTYLVVIRYDFVSGTTNDQYVHVD